MKLRAAHYDVASLRPTLMLPDDPAVVRKSTARSVRAATAVWVAIGTSTSGMTRQTFASAPAVEHVPRVQHHHLVGQEHRREEADEPAPRRQHQRQVVLRREVVGRRQPPMYAELTSAPTSSQTEQRR